MIKRILERLEEEREIAYADFDKYASDYELDLDDTYDDFFHKGLARAKEIVQEVAKEYGRKLNRCDTCIHFTDEEIVPPICYFCCKGMEDNYKAREEEA